MVPLRLLHRLLTLCPPDCRREAAAFEAENESERKDRASEESERNERRQRERERSTSHHSQVSFLIKLFLSFSPQTFLLLLLALALPLARSLCLLHAGAEQLVEEDASGHRHIQRVQNVLCIGHKQSARVCFVFQYTPSENMLFFTVHSQDLSQSTQRCE